MISFIYFDVGGVVIKDFTASNKWEEMEYDLGITKEIQPQFIQFWDSYKNDICIGKDIDTLIPLLRSELNLNIPETYSWLIDFVDRFDPNYSIWKLIQSVSKKYRIGLLTDMYSRMLNEIQASGLLPPVEWDVIVDSSVEGCKKPNREIFDLAQSRAREPAHEILFIDNAMKNIEAAKELGWQTFYYDSSNYEQSTNRLEQMILKGY